MAASVITRDATITNDTGTPAAPNENGTLITAAFINNSIYGPIDQLLSGAGSYTTLRFGGLIAGEGFGTYTFVAGGSGSQLIQVQNTLAGTTNRSGVLIGNDGSGSASELVHTSSTYTGGGVYTQDGLALVGTRVGGVNLAAVSGSGAMSFYTGGTTRRMHIDSSGRIGIGLDAQTDSQVEILAGAVGRRGLVVQGVDDSPAIEALMGSGAAGSGYGIWITGGADANDFPFFIQNAAMQAILAVDALGKFLIGGGSVNNFMTTGIQIHQDANDDEVLCFRSSDVGHGITDIVHTETFADFLKVSGTDGGLAMRGFTQGNVGLTTQGIVTTANTTKTTAGVAAVTIDGILKSGTSVTNMSADANLVAIRNLTTTRFIFDAEGSAHADVEWIAFDDYDDVPLLAALNTLAPRQQDVLKDRFGAWLTYNRQDLLRSGLVSSFSTENGRPHAMLNMTRMHMAEVGAIVELGAKQRALEARIAALERET